EALASEVSGLAGGAGGGTRPVPALAGALARRGLRLALHALIPWGRGVTPEAEAPRVDARVHFLRLPDGPEGRHGWPQATSHIWAAPGELVERAQSGEFFLAPPTLWTLEQLALIPDWKHAVAVADRQALVPVCPRLVPGEESAAPFVALPGDPAHELRERC